MRDEPISASTTNPSAKPPATNSSLGWQATCVQMMPSPPANSIGALPIGPPPKNGHSTMASAPLLASHLPFLVNESEVVLVGYPLIRMCWPSDRRQPCSAFSCMAVTTASPSGWIARATWLPFHSSLRALSVFAPTNHSDAPL